MNENYIPLYRKYRPQTLNEIVGQEHIKKALANAITLNKISHAYLFTGPRGTGKTSTARIFAKSLNCVNGPTTTPCGVCENCIAITNATPVDVIEIDAASNRSVEDAQNILERVMYAPVNSRYKIYIIDEVHMLSPTAFNALLKTLEEPPKNVIFILATTEVQKVLDTIKSRCQRFDFKRITTDDIVKHLKYIANEEKINITNDALLMIAKNSAGGMRDSIALLDQLSVLNSEDAISVDDINSLLGRISFEILNQLAQNLIGTKPENAIEILNNIYNSGNEPVQILTNLLDYLKNLLIVKTCKKEIIIELTQLNESQINDLTKQSELIETHQIISLINKCTEYIKEIKQTSNPQLWLEVAVIDLANLTENTKLNDLQERLIRLEGGIPATKTVTTFYQSAKPVQNNTEVIHPPKETAKKEQNSPQQNPQKQEDFTPVPKSKKAPKDETLEAWSNLFDILIKTNNSPTCQLLKQWTTPIKINEQEIEIVIQSEAFLKQFTEGYRHDILMQAIKLMYPDCKPEINLHLKQKEENKTATNPQKAEPKPEVIIEKIQSAPTKTVEKKPSESVIKKPLAVQTEVVIEDANDEDEIETIEEEEKEAQAKEQSSNKSSMHSDQVNMVKDLFNGKLMD